MFRNAVVHAMGEPVVGVPVSPGAWRGAPVAPPVEGAYGYHVPRVPLPSLPSAMNYPSGHAPHAAACAPYPQTPIYGRHVPFGCPGDRPWFCGAPASASAEPTGIPVAALAEPAAPSAVPIAPAYAKAARARAPKRARPASARPAPSKPSAASKRARTASGPSAAAVCARPAPESKAEDLEPLTEQQQVAVQALVSILLKYGCGMNASATGSGKTRMTLELLRLLCGDRKILVLCPANLVLMWKAELARAGLTGDVISIDRLSRASDGALFTAKGGRWVPVVGKKLLDVQGGTYTATAALKRLARRGVFLVLDEAHLLFNSTSLRNHAAKAVLRAVRKPGSYVMALSATPFNTPVHVYEFLRLMKAIGPRCGELKAIRSLNRWLAEHDAPAIPSGAYGTAVAARRAIGEHWCDHLRSELLVRAGPPKLHHDAVVQALHPDIHGTAYRKALGDLEAHMKKSDNTFMGIFGRLAQLEEAKVPAVVDLIRRALRKPGCKVIVMPRFLSTVEEILRKFPPSDVVVVTGEVPAHKRAELYAQFSEGMKKRVLCATQRASGTGTNLHKLKGCSFVDLIVFGDYNYNTIRQSMGRVGRQGATCPSRASVVFGKLPGESESTEFRLLQNLAKKDEFAKRAKGETEGFSDWPVCTELRF